jgi:hypothetical protein
LEPPALGNDDLTEPVVGALGFGKQNWIYK